MNVKQLSDSDIYIEQNQSRRRTLFYVNDELLKPHRATKGSAGYDFVAPKDIDIAPNEICKFASGVKVTMPRGYVLQLYIRSSLGKRGLTLTNSVGIIDSDFEDEIQAFLINNSKEIIHISKGDRYMQGIFTRYFVTEDDDTVAVRNGGIGSTGK